MSKSKSWTPENAIQIIESGGKFQPMVNIPWKFTITKDTALNFQNGLVSEKMDYFIHGSTVTISKPFDDPFKAFAFAVKFVRECVDSIKMLIEKEGMSYVPHGVISIVDLIYKGGDGNYMVVMGGIESDIIRGNNSNGEMNSTVMAAIDDATRKWNERYF